MNLLKRDDGYTLIEILVVIAIIGILTSLSFTALGPARERMNRAQCAENLRQIALAASNHQPSRNGLPGYLQQYGEFTGGVDPADPQSFSGNVPAHLKVGSWHVALLDYLDHQPLYERWTLDRYPLLADHNGDRAPTAEGSLNACRNRQTLASGRL